MSVQSDFIICTEDEAKSGKIDIDWPVGADRIHMKGLTTVELATLQEILEMGSFDAALDAIQSVYEVSENDGPWVFAIPVEFVDRLNALESDEIETAVEQWGKTDELQHLEKDEVKFIFDSLLDAAARAEAEGKPLYMWNAL